MQAITFEKPGDESVLQLGERPAPSLEPGSVRIRVAATAVNRADLLQRQGFYPPPPGASEILGLECAGEVVEVAPDAKRFARGDRVMALLAGGGYAEEVVVPEPCVMPVPKGLSLIEAAALPETVLTVHLNVFQIGGLRAGGWVLVHGGGSGIGTTTIALAKLAGARVIATAGSAEKCARCVELGADVAIDYKLEDWVAKVKDATSGVGVDVVLDSIGGPYLEGNLQSLAIGGSLVVIGLMGGAKAEIGLGALLARRLRIIGSTLRARPVAEKGAIVEGFLAQFGGDLEAGRLRPIVDRVLPLAEAGQAHRIMKASEHFGKIVLAVGDPAAQPG